MKSILLSLIVVACSMGLSAQVLVNGGNKIARLAKSEHIDKAVMDIIYCHNTVDPILDEERDEYEILQIGNNATKYGDYGSFRLDSTIMTLDSTKIARSEYHKLYFTYQPGSEFVFIYPMQQKLIFRGRVFSDYYVYNEPVPAIDWTLSDGETTICGYTCHKATGDFRGRKWTAWYADEIPMGAGPWKFGGLPGAILKLEDSAGEHEFEAVTVRKSNHPIVEEEKNLFTTTREEYNRSLAEYMNNPAGTISGSELAPRNADGSEKKLPKHRRFYNPIEKE